jgi:hypothetical protein
MQSAIWRFAIGAMGWAPTMLLVLFNVRRWAKPHQIGWRRRACGRQLEIS